ncbi:cutinase-domain-containing protein [Terfezia boudieri ATCC MYA-4762]|uniref:cutinase n=1 Tax=Terfezia boudieri ATCC MYA-4762 TaxID=1051890 RepID=A0A3N4LM05_9PEZI|nr:cutinase-domain-containing protein [Terfezia boudieri ATCC MYA-4762]
MKASATYLLLLVTTFLVVSGVPYPPISSSIEDKIRAEAVDSPVYVALGEAFAQINKQHVVSKRADITRNDLEQGKCAPNIIIFARGTSETGNMGIGVGVPLQNAVDADLPGRVIYQGVNNYPADVAGYLSGGSDTGAKNMAGQVNRAAIQCPGSRVFLSGYSQGAQVTHKAAALIPASQREIVAGIVVFGDPNEGDAFPGTLNNNVLSICYPGDLICRGLPVPIGPHFDYAKAAPQAAAYIKARAL